MMMNDGWRIERGASVPPGPPPLVGMDGDKMDEN